jgi:hypothetical protein
VVPAFDHSTMIAWCAWIPDEYPGSNTVKQDRPDEGIPHPADQLCPI